MIEDPVRLATNPQRVHVAHNAFVRNGARLEAHLAHNGQYYDGRIHVKGGAHIEHDVCISAVQELTIEEKVLIASRVTILDHHHGYENPLVPVVDQPLKLLDPITIGYGSWIGQNAVVMASVGKHCTIGANAVVTHPIPDHSIAVGCPARVIKRYNVTTDEWEFVN